MHDLVGSVVPAISRSFLILHLFGCKDIFIRKWGIVIRLLRVYQKMHALFKDLAFKKEQVPLQNWTQIEASRIPETNKCKNRPDSETKTFLSSGNGKSKSNEEPNIDISDWTVRKIQEETAKGHYETR